MRELSHIFWIVGVPALIGCLVLSAVVVGERLRRNHGPRLRRDGPQPWIERA